LPHYFKTQPRPKAIPYNPSIQRNKAQIFPKLSHGIGQIIYHSKHKRHQWKAKNQRIVHLLVWSETKREKGSKKLNNGSLGAAVFVVPVSLVFLKMRGKVFG